MNEFNCQGQYSSYFLRGTLKSLADMQELPDEDFPFRKQVASLPSDLVLVVCIEAHVLLDVSYDFSGFRTFLLVSLIARTFNFRQIFRYILAK